MKNRIIRIVMLTALIAATLTGIMNPSTALGAKQQYVVTVEFSCGNDTKTYTDINFFTPKGIPIGYMRVSCEDGQTVTGISEPMPTKPYTWVEFLNITDPDNSANVVCQAGTAGNFSGLPTYPSPYSVLPIANLSCYWPLDSIWRDVSLTIYQPSVAP